MKLVTKTLKQFNAGRQCCVQKNEDDDSDVEPYLPDIDTTPDNNNLIKMLSY